MAGTSTIKLGKVDVLALNSSAIDATVGAGSGAASVGGGNSVGVSLGIAVARNFIGASRSGGNVSGTIINSSSNPVSSLTPGMKVRLVDGALAGEIYEYIGAAASDADTNRSGNQLFDLKQQAYRNTTLWRHLNKLDSGTDVRASIRNSQVISSSQIDVSALSDQTIKSEVIGVSAAVAAGSSNSVGVSAAGSYSENISRSNIVAIIDGASTTGTTRLIQAHGIDVTATDTAKINALATGSSLAAAFGGASGVSVSVGVSLAYNLIQNDVTASILNSSALVSTNGISVLSNTLAGDAPTAKYSNSSGTRTLTPGDTVQLSETYDKGGQSGRMYRYRGFTADYDIFSIPFTNAQTNAKLVKGDKVRVSGSTIYTFVGNDDNGNGVVLNLANQNYLNTSNWERSTVPVRASSTAMSVQKKS
jgi:hypothetical protein